MTVIPPRAPVGDPFSGVLSRLGDRCVLSAQPLAGAEILAHGVILRYGARLLEKPWISLVPGLIALERGELMTGETAWDFLYKRSNLFPRAEVFGYKDDGKDAMLHVKRLDLALTPKTLAYADESATMPLAEIAALIGAADDFPARARGYLPLFASVDDFAR